MGILQYGKFNYLEEQPFETAAECAEKRPVFLLLFQ